MDQVRQIFELQSRLVMALHMGGSVTLQPNGPKLSIEYFKVLVGLSREANLDQIEAFAEGIFPTEGADAADFTDKTYVRGILEPMLGELLRLLATHPDWKFVYQVACANGLYNEAISDTELTYLVIDLILDTGYAEAWRKLQDLSRRLDGQRTQLTGKNAELVPLIIGSVFDFAPDHRAPREFKDVPSGHRLELQDLPARLELGIEPTRDKDKIARALFGDTAVENYYGRLKDPVYLRGLIGSASVLLPTESAPAKQFDEPSGKTIYFHYIQTALEKDDNEAIARHVFGDTETQAALDAQTALDVELLKNPAVVEKLVRGVSALISPVPRRQAQFGTGSFTIERLSRAFQLPKKELSCQHETRADILKCLIDRWQQQTLALMTQTSEAERIIFDDEQLRSILGDFRQYLGSKTLVAVDFTIAGQKFSLSAIARIRRFYNDTSNMNRGEVHAFIINLYGQEARDYRDSQARPDKARPFQPKEPLSVEDCQAMVESIQNLDINRPTENTKFFRPDGRTKGYSLQFLARSLGLKTNNIPSRAQRIEIARKLFGDAATDSYLATLS